MRSACRSRYGAGCIPYSFAVSVGRTLEAGMISNPIELFLARENRAGRCATSFSEILASSSRGKPGDAGSLRQLGSLRQPGRPASPSFSNDECASPQRREQHPISQSQQLRLQNCWRKQGVSGRCGQVAMRTWGRPGFPSGPSLRGKVCHPTDVSVWGSMQPTRNYLGRCASGGAQRLANVQLEHDHAVGSPWRAWCLLNARPGKGRGLEATAVFTAWRPACGPPPRRLAKMQITERGLRSTSRLRTTRIGYSSVNNWTRQLRT